MTDMDDHGGGRVATVDVLMITYNAAEYVKRSLPRLLDSCDQHTRVWLWHNGDDEETLATTRDFAGDPRVHRFHHSAENVRLTGPTCWMWDEGDADYVSKVDDDCLLPTDWIRRLRQAHEHNVSFGVVGSSRLRPDDVVPRLVDRKREQYDGGIELMRNHWVQGSGYLLKRRWVDRCGLLAQGQSWTNYCIDLALAGAVNGFLYPFIFEDHMDDPRSEHTLLHSDDDLAWRMPLSVQRNRILSLDDWERRMVRSAMEIQSAPVDLRQWKGWRRRTRNVRNRIAKVRRS